MTEDQIKHMVDRFLAWRLPEPFNPDNGISFTSPFADEPMRSRHWPIGTNLFDARQAEAMVRHLIEGLSQPPAPSPLEGEVQPMPDLEVLGEALFKLSARLKVSGFLDDDANHSAYGAVVAAFNAPSTLSTEAGSGEAHCFNLAREWQ